MIVTPDMELFVVRNLIPKYTSQKLPGQINSPAETFEALKDEHKVLPNGITRTIEEEVGKLQFDPKSVKPLGTIRFKSLDKQVIALPYLIEIESRDSLTYAPKDGTEMESDHPHWIDINNFNTDEKIEINGRLIPLYRTPMAEAVDMVKHNLVGANYPRNVVIEATLDKDFYSDLETKRGTGISLSAK